MKPTSNILFYPADKLHERFDTSKNMIKGPNYWMCHSKISNLGGSEYFLVSIQAKGEHESLNLDNLMMKIDKLDHPHLHDLDYYSYELNLDDKMKRRWDIYFLYEPFYSTFEDLIEHKREKNIRFPDADLLDFMSKMLSLFAYLHQLKIKSLPIHPKYFHLAKKDDVIKFIGLDLGTFSPHHPHLSDDSLYFKAPEEKNGMFDFEKAQVFRLGLIFLSVASLQKITGASYSPKVLPDRIAELTKKVPKLAIDIMKKMLSQKPTERLSFEQLLQEITAKNPMQNLEGNLKNSPVKLTKKISFADEERKEKEGSHSNSPMLPAKRGSIGAKDSPAKFKTIESEEVRVLNPLVINHEKKKPSVKSVHAFIVGTKSLMILPLVNLKTLFAEIIELDILFTIPKCHASVYAEDDKIYLIGGKEEKEQDSNCYYYVDGEDGLVEQGSFNEKRRLSPGVCNVGDLIFVMGGAKEIKGEVLNSCEVFDIKENRWSRIANMKHGCAEALFCSFRNRYIYKIGGVDGSGKALGYIEQYDIRQNFWTEVCLESWNLFIPAKNLFGTQINHDQVFIFGGVSGTGEPVQQTLILNCENVEGPGVEFSLVACPKMFSFDEGKQNQVVVVGGEIAFLSSNESYQRLCTFNGETWRELKKTFNK